MTPAGARGRRALEAAFRDALVAVDAEAAVRRAFEAETPLEPADGRVLPAPASVHVLALGKAAPAMARGARACLGDAIARGLLVTKQGHSEDFDAWPVLEAAHPVPDARCVEAGRRVLAFAASVPAGHRLLVLLSGGASALLSAPVPGLELSDLVRTNELLLASGAPIEEINAVRKRLCLASGGRLAAATPAHRIDVWIVSDVIGDDPSLIASGPCTPDAGGFDLAVRVLRARGAWDGLPPRVRSLLARGRLDGLRDVPEASDAVFRRVHTRIVARNEDAIAAAMRSLARSGARTLKLTGRLAGEASHAGARLAALASSLAAHGPVALVAGGETTVTLGTDVGQGGRNQELALAAALELASGAARGAPAAERVTLLAAGTDGSDGPTDAAGAVVDAATIDRMRRAGFDAHASLARHDALPALAAAGDLLRTGPTGSNVMDLTLAWIEASAVEDAG